MNGFYIRAVVGALLGSAAAFRHERHGIFKDATVGDHTSSRQG
jgi:hypothetical protein